MSDVVLVLLIALASFAAGACLAYAIATRAVGDRRRRWS